MSVIPFVFANTLDEFRIWKQIERYVYRPGFRISLGIINCDFDSHMAEIGPAEPLDNAQRVTVRMARIIEPALVIEAGRFGNERIAVPSSDGITEPAWACFRRKSAAVCENLAEVIELLIEDDHFAGRLNDFKW